MKTLLKTAYFSFFKLCGVYSSKRRANRDKAIVLTYHGVVPSIAADELEYEYRNFVTTAQFEKQLRFMLKHYRPLKVADFCDPDADLSGGFLITFDDGFRNNLHHAAPVLKKLGVEGCFFITTGLIGTRNFLWTELVTRLLHNTNIPDVKLQLDSQKTFSLRTKEDREQASEKIRKYMKVQPLARMREVLQSLQEQLTDVSLTVGPNEEERYLFMTWDEVKELAGEAGQAVAAHTHTHPMLSSLTEDESLFELKKSKELLEEHLGTPVLAMSYPNGQRENYSQTQLNQLKKLGYACAFTQVPLFNDKTREQYELRRVNISHKMNLSVFEAITCGFKN
ncbi:MAG: polysaccharide deacetylase family protein [Calditrichia bacterium]